MGGDASNPDSQKFEWGIDSLKAALNHLEKS